jgi:hypothetical protein
MIAIRAVVFLLLSYAAYVEANFFTWTERTNSPAASYYDIASSSDGTMLAAVTTGPSGGYIFTSTDSGATWQQTSAPQLRWKTIASSSNGMKLAAATNHFTSPEVFTSIDGGLTWSNQANSPNVLWNSITSSSDGTKLAALASDTVYYSTDSGVSWLNTSTDFSAALLQGIASSSDGMKLCVVGGTSMGGGAYIHTSTDGGVSFTQTLAPQKIWVCIASSSDGMKLAAAVYQTIAPPGGNANDLYVYTSSDGGVNWSQQIASSTLYAYYANDIVSSSNGSRLAVTFYGMTMHVATSDDGGVTWNQERVTSPSYGNAIASSDDGTKLAVTSYSADHIFTASPGSGSGSGSASSESSESSESSVSDGIIAAAVLGSIFGAFGIAGCIYFSLLLLRRRSNKGNTEDGDCPALEFVPVLQETQEERESEKANKGDIENGDSPALKFVPVLQETQEEQESEKANKGDIENGDPPALEFVVL